MSAATDVAMITKLQGAAAVTSAAPGGVYWDVAPDAVAMPFVIINLQQHEDGYDMADSRREEARYLVKAVGIGTSSAAVALASDAIEAALQDQPLTIPGYGLVVCHRAEKIRYVEVNGPTRFQHKGGIYLVVVAQ